jgi:hypothetical protein
MDESCICGGESPGERMRELRGVTSAASEDGAVTHLTEPSRISDDFDTSLAVPAQCPTPSTKSSRITLNGTPSSHSRMSPMGVLLGRGPV